MSGHDFSSLLRNELAQAAADVILPILREAKDELVVEIRAAARESRELRGTAPTRLMTIAEVAEEWNVSDRTVRRRIKDGHLESIRKGSLVRLRREDVASFFSNSPEQQNQRTS